MNFFLLISLLFVNYYTNLNSSFISSSSSSSSCNNYLNITNITVSSYSELLQSISCSISIIFISSNIYFDNEIIINNNKNITLIGLPSSSSSSPPSIQLTSNTTRIFLLTNSTLKVYNIIFNGGNIYSNGGIIDSYQSYLLLKNCILQNSIAINGGSLSIQNTSLILDEVQIIQNQAHSLGGGIYCLTSNIQIISSLSSNNIAEYGGFMNLQSCNLDIQKTSIFNNTATLSGGCLYITGNSDISILKSSFKNCRVNLSPSGLSEDSEGGCIFSSNGVSITIIETEFSNNFAAVGSVFRMTSTKLTVSDSLIHNNAGLSSTIEILGVSSLVNVLRSKLYSNQVSFTTSVFFCGYGAVCYFFDTLISGNKALFSAGVNVQYSAKAYLNNCTFINNIAGSSGGAISSGFKSLVVATNCTFERNTALDSAGACLIGDKSEFRIISCIFKGNKANSGGSISVFFSSLVTITTSTFISDTALGHGGSIVVSDSSNAKVINSTFNKCYAVYGGAIYIYSYSFVLVEKSDFLDCIADYEGGSISGYQYSNLTLTDSTFIGNKAIYGGAIFAQFKTFYNIINCSIHENQATYMGGGISIQDETFLNVQNTIFLNNIATYYGAGISSMFSTLKVNNIYAEKNTCELEGGVLHTIFSTLEIQASTLMSNKADSGGVIACNSNSTCISKYNIYFSNNADYGGVLYLSLSSWSSAHDIYHTNTASYGGGSIYSSEFLITELNNITFKNGKSYVGGALVLKKGITLTLQSGTFESNFAKSLAGAIYLESVNTLFYNISFINNIATLDGGAIVSYGEVITSDSYQETVEMKLSLSHCSFSHNICQRKGGAFFSNSVTQLFVKDVYFFNNSAAYGGAISTTQTSGNITHSLFYNNTATYGGGGIYWVYESGGQILTVDNSCKSFGNNAIYGPLKATNVYKLVASRNIDSEENSGSQIQNPIFIEMRDYYNQIVVADSTSGSTGNVVYSSTADSYSSLQGSTIEQTNSGIATFGNITVTYKPNSSVILYFDMSNTVERAEFELSFRPCVPGEIVLSLFGEMTVCSKCPPGSYSLKENAKACKLCPEHAVCRGGNIIDVKHGYWRLGEVYDNVKLCLVKDACLGGEDPSTQCRKGHKGPYCSVCEDGYYKHGGLCLACSTSGAKLIVAILPTLCVLFCLLLYYLWIMREKIIDYFWSQADELIKTAETYHLGALKTKFKILLAFVQIINQIPFALDVDFPQIYIKFLDLLWVFNLDFIDFLNFECIYERNFYDKLVEATLGPFILIGSIFIILYTRQFISYRLNSLNPSYTYAQFRNEMIFCSLLVSFVVFSPVSIKILQTFACEKFEDGSVRLISDYTIHCNGSEYNFYVVYSILMVLVYPIGVPTLYFVLLYLNRQYVNPRTHLVVLDNEREFVSQDVIQKEKIKLRNTYKEISVISFLFMTYEPRRWYFEILDCIRRLMMTAVPVLIMRGEITQIVIVLLVSLVCVAVYMELKPYTTKSDNTVAVISQWAISGTVIVSILIRVGDNRGLDRQALGIIAILVNTTVFILTLVLLLVNEEEVIPSSELQALEHQKTSKKKIPNKNNLTLSNFIEMKSVEKRNSKRQSKDQNGIKNISETNENKDGNIDNKKDVNDDINENINNETNGKNGRRDSVVKRRLSLLSKMSKSVNGNGNSDSNGNSNDNDNGNKLSEVTRKSSVSISNGIELDRISFDQKVSRLLRKDEKDSDDESDSDDDKGDSDDDTPTKTIKKKRQSVVTNPIQQNQNQQNQQQQQQQQQQKRERRSSVRSSITSTTSNSVPPPPSETTTPVSPTKKTPRKGSILLKTAQYEL